MWLFSVTQTCFVYYIKQASSEVATLAYYPILSSHCPPHLHLVYSGVQGFELLAVVMEMTHLVRGAGDVSMHVSQLRFELFHTKHNILNTFVQLLRL